MKRLLSMSLVFIFSMKLVWGGISERMLEFTYQKPYKYEFKNGSYRVLAIVKSKDWAEEMQVSFNNEVIPAEKSENGDWEIKLPLIGNPGFLEISYGKNKGVRKQFFEPLIPADWDYFANGKIHIIIFSHQDIGWMDEIDFCRNSRVNDIILPALDQIDEEKEFKFELEQTLNLMEVLEDSPKDRLRIIDAYKSGNFEWGATLNQPYEGLESGEQLVRQSYLGRRWIKKNLPGMDAKVAFNIDVPGRSLQAPQLFKKSGIDYLFVTRMREGFFNWYSPDGTSIFTYSSNNYGWFHYHHPVLEKDVITAMHELHKTLKGWDKYYSERNIPPHYGLVLSADGTHAGKPKYYKEIIEGWNEIVENSGLKIPEIRHSTASQFFEKVDVPEAKIDSISGERPNLWLYIHGAAHYQAIKAKRQAAVNLPAAEKFNTINCELEGDFSTYPQKEFEKAWFNTIYPDHGWGGKNGHITDSLFQAALETGNEIGERLLNSSLSSIAEKVELKNNQNIVVFNDLSWNRDGYATIDISHLKGTNWIVADSKGNIIPTQLINDNDKKELIFVVNNMPSIGYKTFVIKKGKNEPVDIKAVSNFCDNQFYTMELGQGGISRLFDKALGREVFNTTSMIAGDLFNLGYRGTGAGEHVFIMGTDAGGIDRAHEKQSSWSLIESGEVYSRFQSEYDMKTFSVRQIITVYHQKKQIDLEYDVLNWPGEHNRQIRVLFPLQMTNDAQISYDVPMGMVHVGKDELTMRPGGFAWGGNYHQKPVEIRPREIQNFITANGDGFGFTMSTDIVTADWVDPSMNAGDYPVINLVLLSSHKSCNPEGNWYEQKGNHSFKLSITTHEEGWKNGFHFGVAANHPMHSVLKSNKQKGELPAEKSFVSTSDPFAVITTIKKAEDDDDVVIRLLEAEGADKEIKVNLSKEVKSIAKTDMIEENPVDIQQSGETMKVKLGKDAVDTYKMKTSL